PMCASFKRTGNAWCILVCQSEQTWREDRLQFILAPLTESTALKSCSKKGCHLCQVNQPAKVTLDHRSIIQGGHGTNQKESSKLLNLICCFQFLEHCSL
uniref:Uncharacterized protein n=2 Tax=Aegilops tauschii subsp. strangulata TaxID=200361 RepID=A0A453R5G6_AEGTS